MKYFLEERRVQRKSYLQAQNDKQTCQICTRIYRPLGRKLKKIHIYTECPKIYHKSVLHLLRYTANLYLSRCVTDLR